MYCIQCLVSIWVVIYLINLCYQTVKSGKEGDEDNDDNNEEEVDGRIVYVLRV